MDLSPFNLRFTGLTLALALFLASLGFETLRYDDSSDFLLGIVCLLFGIAYLPWYSNPVNLATVVLLLIGKDKWAVVTAVAATTLALSAFALHEIPRDTAGNRAEVIGYGLGFWLWLCSSIALLGTSVYCAMTSGRSGPTRGDEEDRRQVPS